MTSLYITTKYRLIHPDSSGEPLVILIPRYLELKATSFEVASFLYCKYNLDNLESC